MLIDLSDPIIRLARRASNALNGADVTTPIADMEKATWVERYPKMPIGWIRLAIYLYGEDAALYVDILRKNRRHLIRWPGKEYALRVLVGAYALRDERDPLLD